MTGKHCIEMKRSGVAIFFLIALMSGLSSYFSNQALAADVAIDSAWIDSHGPAPYYLNQSGTTYTLQTDVSTPGTAFAIIASGITLDLNGHTITHDNTPKIVIPNASFEDGSGGWSMGTAPNASIFQGTYLWNEVYDGNYSLKFSLPAVDQSVVSTSTITLEPNTTYSLSAMFEYGGKGETTNPGVKGYVRLIGSGLPTREVYHNGTNWRGIQFREGIFTTGPVPETYTVTVGIEGAAAVAATNFFIDDIKIQRTRIYGVTAAAHSWSLVYYPGCTQFGRGTNAVIKNGYIVQGTGEATWAHGVFAQEVGGVTIQDLNITVHGANASAIAGMNPGTFVFTIFGNTLTSNVRTIFSRDSFNGAVLYGTQGQIYNNTITNGPHAGIITYNGGIASDIHDNVIQLKAKYTNAFAIGAGRGSQIHGNIINCETGEYACRGIASSGDPNSAIITRIFGNTIKVQILANNQEYQGSPIGGAYGIQTENAKNIEVYSNDVYAYGNAVAAYAYRANSDAGASTNIWVHHNTFRAIAGSAHAASVKLSDIPSGVLRFEDNTLITNDGIVGGTTGSYVTFVRTHITRQTPIADPYIFETDWWPTLDFNALLSFVDTVFEDTAAKSYFENAVVRNSHRYGGLPDNRMAFTLGWTATVNVIDSLNQPVYQADVSIKDFYDTSVFSGQTDSDGKVSSELVQYMRSSTAAQSVIFDVKTPHNFTASYGEFLDSTSVTMDASKSVTLTLGSINPLPPNITTQPLNQTVTAGQTATFTVVASGTSPLAYQWQRNSVNISGATSSSHTTPATTIADNGALFACVVSNIVGSVTSNSATLTVNAPADTTAPVISSITNTTKATTATIKWTTNEPSTSQVEYGLTTSYGNSSVFDSNLVTSHSVMLTGLTTAKTYHFRVKSKDAAGNLAVSGDAVFKTKRK